MIKFVCYNTEGNIVNWGSCADEALEFQDPLGNQLLVGEGSDLTHYVHNDGLLAYSTEQAQLKEQRPKIPCKWSNTLMQWVDLRTLVQQKEAKWNELKQARSAAEYAGFTWDGSVFDSDTLSQGRLAGALSLAQLDPDFSIAWVLKDNTVRVLSQDDMFQVSGALGAHVALQFSKGITLRTQVEGTTSIEQLNAISW